jgi:hypothetical protein
MEPVRVPHFIIGGAPRSGTTFLAEALDRHPGIFMAKPFRPEPKVFLTAAADRDEYLRRYRPLFAGAGVGQVLGEKTTNYFESEEACLRMRDALPTNVRLLFLLREPVARAYSNYLWSKKNGLEPLSFEEAVALEGNRRSVLPPEKARARPHDYLSRSDYARHAQRYLDAFGVPRIDFFLYEDIERQPERLLAAVQRFIGVEPLPFLDLDVGVVNSAAEVGPPLDPVIAARLRERLAPSVARLAALTGLNLAAWAPEAVSKAA